MEDTSLAAIQGYLADRKNTHLRVTGDGSLQCVQNDARWKSYSFFRPKPKNERIATILRAINTWADDKRRELSESPRESLSALDQIKQRFSKREAFAVRLREIETEIEGLMWKPQEVDLTEHPYVDDNLYFQISDALSEGKRVYVTPAQVTALERVALRKRNPALTEELRFWKGNTASKIPLEPNPKKIAIWLSGNHYSWVDKELVGSGEDLNWAGYDSRAAEALLTGLSDNRVIRPDSRYATDLAKLARRLPQKQYAQVNALVQPPAHTTVLSQAIRNDDKEVIDTLLAQGYAKVDRAAFVAATEEGDVGLIRQLLERGGIPFPAGSRDQDPLQSALDGNQPEVFGMLLPYYLDMNYRDGNPTLAKLALELSESRATTQKGKDGGLLHWAVGKGDLELATLLLRRKIIDPNKANRNGVTPLELAFKRKDDAMVAMLIRHGAKPTDSKEFRKRREAISGQLLAARTARHNADQFDRTLVASDGTKIETENARLSESLREVPGGDIPLERFDAPTINLYLNMIYQTQLTFEVTPQQLRALWDFASYFVDEKLLAVLKPAIEKLVPRTESILVRAPG